MGRTEPVGSDSVWDRTYHPWTQRYLDEVGRSLSTGSGTPGPRVLVPPSVSATGTGQTKSRSPGRVGTRCPMAAGGEPRCPESDPTNSRRGGSETRRGLVYVDLSVCICVCP